MQSTRMAVVVVVVVVAVATVAVEVLSLGRLGDPQAVSAAAETAAFLVGMAVTGLLVARLRRTSRRHDLCLAITFALLSASALLWSAVPHALELERGGVVAWASTAGAAVAATCLLVALRSGERRTGHAATLATVLVVVEIEALAVLAALSFVPAGPPPLAVAAGTRLVLAAAFFLLAWRERDRLLAIGSVLAACAFASGAAHAALPLPGVGLGDLLRLTAFTAVLAGLVAELLAHWRAVATTAVEAERHRLARDLHDGLAQELAALVRSSDDPGTREMARRALRDARAAIHALHHDDGAPLDVLISRAVADAARRTGAEVVLALDTGVAATARDRRELPRIAGQAVDNAAAHGRASRIEVTLCDGPRLAVRDDGCGISGPPGHGLRGMAERAALAGRRLRVRSAPWDGTTVEVDAR